MTRTKCPGPQTPQQAAQSILRQLILLGDDVWEIKELLQHATKKNEPKNKPKKLPKRR